MNVIEFVQAGGFVMYPLLLMSFAIVVIIVERAIAFRQLGDLAPDLVQDVVKMVRAGRDREALELCRKRNGPVAASMATVLANVGRPKAEVESLVEETAQEYFIRLERWLPVLDTITTMAPLLGLLGTIIGMTGTFNAFTEASRRGAPTVAVLGGVAEALYATATGIAVALISFAGYNYFTARVRVINSETAQAATRVLNAVSTRSTATSEVRSERGAQLVG